MRGKKTAMAAWWGVGLMAWCLGGVPATVGAWQTDGAKPSNSAAPSAAEANSAESGAKKRTEPRGRLPAYFGEVIDSQQREKIYELQARYLAEIKTLQDKIAELEKKREEDVQGILTPEQAEKVKQFVENAKSKRTEASKRKKLAATATPMNDTSSRP
jgi:flagellar motility protein MotE (MotC chaperone)